MSTEQWGRVEELAIVQCWLCLHHEARTVPRGTDPEEIRCSQCGGAVEVLTINGEPV